MTNEKVSKFIKLYMNYAVIAAICLAYIVLAVLKIVPSQKGIFAIISESIITFILASTITTLFRNFGLRLGEMDDDVRCAISAHEKQADRCAPLIDKLSEWCIRETKSKLKQERIRILADESLEYDMCFCEDGTPKPYEPKYLMKKPFKSGFLYSIRYNKVQTRRAKASLRAICLRITPLYAGDLMSEGHKRGDPFYMGRSKREFKLQSTRTGILSRILITLISGYYGVDLIKNFSPAMLMWRILQVVIFIALGVIQQAMAMDYMTDEFRSRMIRKRSYLLQFQKAYGIEGDSSDGEDTNEEGENNI